MTLEELLALKPGDKVYRISGRTWDTNAILRGRPAFLHIVEINKVNKKTVSADTYSAMGVDDVLTLAEGAPLIAEETERRERRAALERRWAAASRRIQLAARASTALGVNEHQQYLSLSSTDLDAVERLATLLELGEQALLLQGALNQRLSVESPMVHLHLNVTQAAHVLALLQLDPPGGNLARQ